MVSPGRTGLTHLVSSRRWTAPSGPAQLAIMRVIGGRNVLVSGTIVRHGNASSSRFSRTIRVKRHALYRIFVKVTNGAQTSNYSSPLFIR